MGLLSRPACLFGIIWGSLNGLVCKTVGTQRHLEAKLSRICRHKWNLLCLFHKNHAQTNENV